MKVLNALLILLLVAVLYQQARLSSQIKTLRIDHEKETLRLNNELLQFRIQVLKQAVTDVDCAIKSSNLQVYAQCSSATLSEVHHAE